jgi:hypothetical protein
MNVAAIMEEIGAVLDTLTGLRVSRHPVGKVVPPAGVVGYPDRIDYDQTYGRGMDRIRDLSVVLVVGKVTERSARDKVGEWTRGAGPQSVKQTLEAHAWTSCHEVSVTDATFDTISIAAVDYLAALFQLDIVGNGTD